MLFTQGSIFSSFPSRASQQEGAPAGEDGGQVPARPPRKQRKPRGAAGGGAAGQEELGIPRSRPSPQPRPPPRPRGPEEEEEEPLSELDAGVTQVGSGRNSDAAHACSTQQRQLLVGPGPLGSLVSSGGTPGCLARLGRALIWMQACSMQLLSPLLAHPACEPVGGLQPVP